MNTPLPPTSREDLRAEVGAPPQSEQGLIAWVPKAALLAVLGDASFLAKFPGHLARLRLEDARWFALLQKRVQKAAWDFRHASGEEFGVVHLDAQEWHLAYRLLPGASGRAWTLAETRLFEAWADDACDHKVLDAEAQAAILNWRETWEVAEEWLLSPVRTPMTEGERWVAAGLMRDKGKGGKEVVGRIGGGKPISYPFPLRVNRPALAAAGSDERLEECAELRFISPDKRYEASVFLPRYTQDGGDRLRVEIYATGDNGDASALQGAKASLDIGPQAATILLDNAAQGFLSFAKKLEGVQEIDLAIQGDSWAFVKAVVF